MNPPDTGTDAALAEVAKGRGLIRSLVLSTFLGVAVYVGTMTARTYRRARCGRAAWGVRGEAGAL